MWFYGANCHYDFVLKSESQSPLHNKTFTDNLSSTLAKLFLLDGFYTVLKIILK